MTFEARKRAGGATQRAKGRVVPDMQALLARRVEFLRDMVRKNSGTRIVLKTT